MRTVNKYNTKQRELILLCLRENKDNHVTVDDIMDYFKEDAKSDSVADALAELGADYDELSVRLVRIKFLCEVAS